MIKRVLDIGGSVIGLLVVSPLLLVVAVLIKLDSPGPVLFCQERIGRGFVPFVIYKFRTMRPSDESAPQVWATANDSRITPIGHVLREYRLDELPQLVNVLRGEMNIVGPRPEQPKIFMELRDQIEGYEKRQRVLPGITGLAQVSHHYDSCVDDVRRKLSFDLEYIRRESAMEDLRILLKTVPVMLFRKGAL